MKELKVDSTNIIFPLATYISKSEKIRVLNGSKMIISLFVKTLSGSKVNLSIKNSFSPEYALEEIESIELTEVGRKDITLLDFHDYFQFDLEVNGNAEVIVATTLRNSSNEDILSSSQIIKELNRLVPEFYDDVETIEETIGKQPTKIEFRLKGKVVRTIQIDYINEVFKRAKAI